MTSRSYVYSVLRPLPSLPTVIAQQAGRLAKGDTTLCLAIEDRCPERCICSRCVDNRAREERNDVAGH